MRKTVVFLAIIFLFGSSYSIFQVPVALGYMPHTRDECIPDKLCFVLGDYLTYYDFLNENMFSIRNYTYAGPLDVDKIWVNFDYISIEETGNYTQPQTGMPMYLCCGHDSGGKSDAVIQSSPVRIEKWTRDSPSAETLKDIVTEDSYNYNGFMRKVIVINIESPSEIIDKETGILLFHHDTWFGSSRTVKLAATNIIQSSNFQDTNNIQSSNFPEIYSSLPSSSVTQIPSWIKNTALWWSDGKISDGEFISGIQFLINEKIIQISAQSKLTGPTLPFVPNWIKDTAGWWGTNKVTDADFINGIKWLIENGILRV